MGKPLFEIEKELAKQRQSAQGIIGESSLGKILPNDEEFGKAIELFADKIGSNPETVRQGLWLIDNAPKEELDALRIDEKAISNLYKETKRWQTIAELKERAKELPKIEGKYDVIIVDPPWPYGTNYDPQGRRCASPYPEMNINELMALELPTVENCVLWLWTTNAFIHDAFHILASWGFEPKTVLTWAKDSMGLGDWLRGQTEHCILAIRGKPIINLTNQTTLLRGKARDNGLTESEAQAWLEQVPAFTRQIVTPLDDRRKVTTLPDRRRGTRDLPDYEACSMPSWPLGAFSSWISQTPNRDPECCELSPPCPCCQ
jgi:N6-adenosine-specific RNA methylase IME4